MRDADADDESVILRLANRGDWAPLRYLALFGYDISGDEQRDRVRERLQATGVHLVSEEGDTLNGSLSAWEVGDLTEHFGIPVFELGPILTESRDPQGRGSTAVELLSALRDTLSARGRTMSMLRVECDDLASLHAAEALGFRSMETSLTWVNDLERTHLNSSVSPRGMDVIPLPVEGEEALRQLAPLRTGARMVMALDHYHADPRLPDELCDALYERRFERALAGEGADVAVVHYHGGSLGGAGFWRACREYEQYGVSMAGSGYGFRVPGVATGNTEDFTAFVCNTSITGNRLLEWTTQAANLPQVNMITRQRSIRLVRSSHMLHCWTE